MGVIFITTAELSLWANRSCKVNFKTTEWKNNTQVLKNFFRLRTSSNKHKSWWVVDLLEVRNLSITTAFRAGSDLKLMHLLSEFKPTQPLLPN